MSMLGDMDIEVVESIGRGRFAPEVDAERKPSRNRGTGEARARGALLRRHVRPGSMYLQ